MNLSILTNFETLSLRYKSSKKWFHTSESVQMEKFFFELIYKNFKNIGRNYAQLRPTTH